MTSSFISNLLLFLLIVLYSNCTRKPKTELLTPVTTFKKVQISYDADTCRITLDSSYLFNYKRFSTNGVIYAGYNPNFHSIDLFNLQEKISLKHIKLSKEGPESIQRVGGIYYHNMDSIFILDENHLAIFTSDGLLVNKISINSASSNEIFSSNFFMAGNDLNNFFYDQKKKCIYLENLEIRLSQCSKGFYEKSVVGKISLVDNRSELIPINFPEIFKENYYGFFSDLQFSLTPEGEILYNFQMESTIYSYDPKTGNKKAYGGESSLSPSIASPLAWSACNDIDLKMRHYIENIRFCSVIHDPYRKLNYRFHHGEAKGKNPDGSFKKPKQKAQILTVFNESFDILYEMKIDDRKYIIPFAFVGPEGLYVNAPKGEDYLRFKIFKFKVI